MKDVAEKMNQLLVLNEKVYGHQCFGEYIEKYIDIQKRLFEKGHLHCYVCKNIVDVSDRDIRVVSDSFRCRPCETRIIEESKKKS